MARRSPLEILKELRQRAHESQQAQLAEQVQTKLVAEALAERARSVLLEAVRSESSARSEEDRRLVERGITAAEGQQRLAWERGLRQSRAELAERLDRAIDGEREAAAREERTQLAVQQSDVELKLVRGRLDRVELFRQHELERARQEDVDETSLRRFLERKGT